jgi:hypothetical protein
MTASVQRGQGGNIEGVGQGQARTDAQEAIRDAVGYHVRQMRSSELTGQHVCADDNKG